MTRLDHNRAMAQLAAKTGATVNDITKMTIWGNHSATQYPDLFHAEVDGKNAADAGRRPGLARGRLHPHRAAARRRHHRGPRARRRPPRAANAAIDHVRDLGHRHPRGRLGLHGRPVRRQLRRARGPHVARSRAPRKDGEWAIVQGLEIDDFSRARIDASVAELAEERDAVKELGSSDRPCTRAGLRDPGTHEGPTALVRAFAASRCWAGQGSPGRGISVPSGR